VDDSDETDSPEESILYLNTDLDLVAEQDLTELASALESRGLTVFHVMKGDDLLWYARFETDIQADEPERTIEIMVAALESLPGELCSVLRRCRLEELDIGYECGDTPWAFNQGLPNALLGRIASLGASLGVTIHPHSREGSPGCRVRPIVSPSAPS